MKGTFVVYLLENTKHRRYIGMTSDLPKRLDAHGRGLSKYTKSRGPWQLRWTSSKLSHCEALRLEALLKKQKGGAGLDGLLQKYRGS